MTDELCGGGGTFQKRPVGARERLRTASNRRRPDRPSPPQSCGKHQDERRRLGRQSRRQLGPRETAARIMEAVSYRVESLPVVNLRIGSSLTSFVSEKRFNRGITVSEFKCKLELIVGSPASCMDLELFSPDDKFLGLLDQDDVLLGSYPVDDRCRIHSGCSKSKANLACFDGHQQTN